MVRRDGILSNRGAVLRVVLPYVVFGSAWILFSDRLILPLAQDDETLLWLSTAKGWFFILVTSALLFVQVLREARRRSALERELRAGLREKEALLAEVHHRVKNNLQVVTSILNLERDGIVGEEAAKLNADTRARLRSMSLVHEELYGSPGIARIELSGYLRDLVGSMPELFDVHGVRIEYELEKAEVGPDRAISFGLFVTEAVTNALRHGALPGAPVEAMIVLRRVAEDKALFAVRDRGPGIPAEESRRGLGFRLMEALAGQLDGEMEIPKGSGGELRLLFPVEGGERG